LEKQKTSNSNPGWLKNLESSIDFNRYRSTEWGSTFLNLLSRLIEQKVQQLENKKLIAKIGYDKKNWNHYRVFQLHKPRRGSTFLNLLSRLIEQKVQQLENKKLITKIGCYYTSFSVTQTPGGINVFKFTFPSY